MSPTIGVTALLATVLLAVAGVFALRQSRKPARVKTAAGPEVISTRGGRPRPDAPQPPFAKLTRSRSRPEKDRSPARRVAADPRLTGPVVLEAAWSQSVYHGSRSTEDGFKIAVRAATARGRSHAYNGDPGQDAAGVAWCESRRSVFLVVADGLGSKPESGQVAHDVVDQVASQAAELRASDDPARMLERVVDATEWSVRQGKVDGASTLVAAEIRADRDGCQVITWGIGDSEAWVLADGAWKSLHHERRTDAENITRHLPGHREMLTRHVRVRRGSVVTLASDGFANALGNESPMARELAERWRKPPTPLEFLSQVNFDDSYFNDDRAAVAVWIQ